MQLHIKTYVVFVVSKPIQWVPLNIILLNRITIYYHRESKTKNYTLALIPNIPDNILTHACTGSMTLSRTCCNYYTLAHMHKTADCGPPATSVDSAMSRSIPELGKVRNFLQEVMKQSIAITCSLDIIWSYMQITLSSCINNTGNLSRLNFLVKLDCRIRNSLNHRAWPMKLILSNWK